MAKRFTDTTKWEKIWIRKLTPAKKCFLFYLWDACSPAGIWTVDFETAEHFIGGKIPHENFFPADTFPIVPLENGRKWFIVEFIPFQYPNGLQPNNRAHSGIIRELEKHNIDPFDIQGALMALERPFQGPCIGAKDKDKDKDKDKALNENVPSGIYHLWKQVEDDCPSLLKMTEPLTPVQLYRIATKWPYHQIIAVLKAMENKPDLKKKYKSANLTAQNWLNRETRNPGDRPMISKKNTPEPEPEPPPPGYWMGQLKAAYKDPEQATPQLYDFVVRAGLVEVTEHEIVYKGEKISKKECLNRAHEDIRDVSVGKKHLTIKGVMTKFADPKDLAKILAVKKLLEIFLIKGTPWQTTQQP